MTTAYRKRLIRMLEESDNFLFSDSLRLLMKTYDDIDECEKAEKRAAARMNYTDAIKLIGMVDAFKKVRWDLERILDLH